MNKNPGALARTICMSQLVAEDGTVTPVTVLQVSSYVIGTRTQDKDGYSAIVLGIDEQKENALSKPLAGQFKKAGVTPKATLREFRCEPEALASVEAGKEIDLAEIFAEGQHVDVTSVSRGRGFTGVMRRYNFGGAGGSHGAHEYKRHGGSIGTNMTPGRVLPGRKMPGQHGNKQVSVLNQRVAKILPEKNLVMLRGAVPGARGALVEIRGAVKKKNGGKPA